jgi:type I restriction enzyme M protein
MKHSSKLGSRIAEVHNGSSLFTGDAGQGESNVRRWIIENDWLEAIVALPLNMFYNTGIATYIWVLTNRKPTDRKGKVQLIDATGWFKPLRKNLGKKNCEMADQDIDRIIRTFMEFKESEQSKIFSNAAFGYWRVTVERPLRLHSQITRRAIESLRFASGDQPLRSQLYDKFGEVLFDDFESVRGKVEAWLTRDKGDDGENDEEEHTKKTAISEKKRKKLLNGDTWQRDARLIDAASKLRGVLGDELFTDHNSFRVRVDDAFETLAVRLTAPEKKLILRAASWRVEGAPRVIAKVHKKGAVNALHGVYQIEIKGESGLVEYEADTELRDTEQVPLLEEGGIEAFISREVLPYAADAWVNKDATKIGYEVSFNRYFYRPQQLRPLDEIRKDILALEQETKGLLEKVVGSSI